jgi:hypothetical protein
MPPAQPRRGEAATHMNVRTRLALLAVPATLLAGCVHAPVTQASYPFEKHPGVSMEVRWQDGYEMGTYASTYVVNRSSVDKCAWTERLDSRLLRPGETWLVSELQSPGNIGVANVLPWDPKCAKAKAEHTAPAR